MEKQLGSQDNELLTEIAVAYYQEEIAKKFGVSIEERRNIPCVIAIASGNTKALAILGALRTSAIDIIATSASNIHTILNMTQ